MQAFLPYTFIMTKRHKDNSIVGVSEVARLLRCSPATIYRMVEGGRLTPVDPPSPALVRQRRRFLRADVERIAASKTPQAE